MPSLTEMLDAIEAALRDAGIPLCDAVGNSVRPAGWVPKFSGQSSPGILNVCGPGYGTGKNAPGNVEARARARLIAALLNSARPIVTAARSCANNPAKSEGTLNNFYHAYGADNAATGIIRIIYNALVAAGAIKEAGDAHHD